MSAEMNAENIGLNLQSEPIILNRQTTIDLETDIETDSDTSETNLKINQKNSNKQRNRQETHVQEIIPRQQSVTLSEKDIHPEFLPELNSTLKKPEILNTSGFEVSDVISSSTFRYVKPPEPSRIDENGKNMTLLGVLKFYLIFVAACFVMIVSSIYFHAKAAITGVKKTLGLTVDAKIQPIFYSECLLEGEFENDLESGVIDCSVGGGDSRYKIDSDSDSDEEEEGDHLVYQV